jgi:hypothetical protein
MEKVFCWIPKYRIFKLNLIVAMTVFNVMVQLALINISLIDIKKIVLIKKKFCLLIFMEK